MHTQILNALNTEEILNKIIVAIENSSEGFPDIKKEYEQSLLILRNELGDEKVDRLLEAINSRCVADLLFCANLGYRANLNNFRDPIARTFMDIDFAEYLRIEVLQNMPQRCAAETEINEFLHSIHDKEEVFNAISCYLTALELDLTKLAHYMGFMFANEILFFTEPGYAPNPVLSLRYRSFINEWFGIELATIL